MAAAVHENGGSGAAARPTFAQSLGTTSHITIVGWIVFLLALYMVNKSKSGHTVIYWTLVTIAVYLLIANYRRIIPIIRTGSAGQ